MTTVLSEKNVVARKSHLCVLCARIIDKGQLHYTQKCADGGQIWTWRAHRRCMDQWVPYLKWCGIEPWHWDDFDDIDHDAFREFVDNNQDDKS